LLKLALRQTFQPFARNVNDLLTPQADKFDLPSVLTVGTHFKLVDVTLKETFVNILAQ